jgi:hypothetical protein
MRRMPEDGDRRRRGGDFIAIRIAIGVLVAVAALATAAGRGGIAIAPHRLLIRC